MLELRPLWGFILGLNLCLLIWRISVQEPAMLEVEMSPSANAGYMLHYKAKQPPIYGGKHLLADYQAQAQQQQHQQQNDSTVATIANELPAADAGTAIANAGHSVNINQMPTTSQKNANNYHKKTKKEHKVKLYNALQRSQQQQQQQEQKQQQTAANSNKTVAIGGDTERSLAAIILNKNKKYTNRRKDAALRLATSTLTTAAPFSLPLPAIPAYLPADDFRQLIDLYNFAYVLPHAGCTPNINTLILVHSAPHNYAKRMLIRETWGSAKILSGTPLQIIFLLGAVQTVNLQRSLTSEYAMYGDLVQGNFIDDYRNMTYKHVMAFKWFLYNCAHAKLLLKVDDDVFVNTPQLLQYMRAPASTLPADSTQPFDAARSLYHPSTRNLLFCEQSIGSRVKRTYRSKWRVSFKEYSGRFYPPYCPGYVIIYTADVVQRLYMAAQRHAYFWIDDVHITGVLAQATNTTITTSRNYVLYKADCERLLAQVNASGDGKTDTITNTNEFLFASHSITPQQMRAIWNLYAARLPHNATAANVAHNNNNTSAASSAPAAADMSIPLKTSIALSTSLPYPHAVAATPATAAAGLS